MGGELIEGPIEEVFDALQKRIVRCEARDLALLGALSVVVTDLRERKLLSTGFVDGIELMRDALKHGADKSIRDDIDLIADSILGGIGETA